MAEQFGEETIPMTMQAEIVTLSLDEAIASGQFDQADAQGMVRIPVTVRLPWTAELSAALGLDGFDA